MASSLFPQHSSQPKQINPMMQQFNTIAQMMGGNPQGFVANLMQQNPSFKTFVENHRGQSITQIGREVGQQQGFDFDSIYNGGR